MIKRRLIRRAEGKTWDRQTVLNLLKSDVSAFHVAADELGDEIHGLYDDLEDLLHKHFYVVDGDLFTFDGDDEKPENLVAVNSPDYDATVNEMLTEVISALDDFGYREVYQIFVDKDTKNIYTSGGDDYEKPREIEALIAEGYLNEVADVFLSHLEGRPIKVYQEN